MTAMLAGMCVILYFDLSVWYSGAVVNIYIIGFCFGSAPITWLYLADILPDLGVSLASSFLWVFSALIGISFPWIKNNYSIFTAFVIYFMCTAFGLLFMIFVLVETSGKT